MKNIFLLLIFSFSVSLKAQNYIPDPSFGGTGTVVTNYNMYYDNDQAPRNVFFENNKYIFTQKTQVSCFSYDGNVDYTFGTLGYSRIIIPNCQPASITIKSSKIINNTIFVYGKSYDSNTNLFYGFIAKMNIDGVIDTTFGNNGIVTVTIGTTSNNPYSDGITDVVFKNGNYFGIGSVFYMDANSIYRRNIFTVKLNANGIIDLTNDPTGMKKINSIDGHEAVNIYEHQGDLLIIGHITNNNSGNEDSLTILKIDDSGNLIPTFGVNGVKKIPLSPSGWQTGESFNNCRLTGDDVYILRTYFLYSNVVQKIQKVNITNLNTTDISVTNNNSIVTYVIDSDKIYIIGCLSTCPNDFNIIRRNVDGTLDNTFNQTGTYNYDFPPPNSFTTTYDSATVLVKDVNNALLIGGYTSTQFDTTAPYRGFAMLRIQDETLSTKDLGMGRLLLSPNPVQTILNIANPNGISIDDISIYDVLGKIVYYSATPPDKINLETLKEGLYFVKINRGNTNERFKIIKRN
jgi:hypothetical protein